VVVHQITFERTVLVPEKLSDAFLQSRLKLKSTHAITGSRTMVVEILTSELGEVVNESCRFRKARALDHLLAQADP